jgi:hypothetical protein
MKKLILTFWILIMVVWPVSVNAAENQKIIFGGSYSLNLGVTDADSAWLYMFYYASLVGSTKVTAEDLQWDGCYQHTHQCTNDSADGWTGWWIYFDSYSNSTISVSEWGAVASARDSGFVEEILSADMTLYNVYGTLGMLLNALGGIQALALAPASHEQTTTRIALNLTATTNDLFNGCLINARSGNNEGFTTRITDYEAYSGDSGVVIVSPPLVLAATENQAFVITGAAHWGDTVQTQLASEAQVDSTFDTLVAASARIGDVEKISGDATAADNFETMLDGTGGQQLTLKRLSIDGANSTNGSFYVNNDDGHGAIFKTSSPGTADAGLHCLASAGNNFGAYFTGTGAGAAIYGLGGSGGGSGLTLYGSGGGSGVLLLGNGAGDGLYSQGGATGGDGIHLVGDNTGYDFNATLNLDDTEGDYDKDDFADDFFETMSDTNRIRNDSLFTQAASLLAMIDGGNELVDLDTLLWIAAQLDTVIDSLLTQAWASVDACAGAGAYTCSLTVVDTTNDVTVSGVQVTVNNQTEDGTEYYLTSNSSGHAIVSLNNGDYRASAIGQPYIFASTDFTVSSAARQDDIEGYAPTISTPPSAAVATVYGYFITGGHDTLSNMDVTFELAGYAAAIDTSADALVTMSIIRAVTDGNGKVEVTLLKNENLKVTDSDSLVYPWWTCKAADPTWEFIIHFTIDNDSTTFNLGVESDAVQFQGR